MYAAARHSRFSSRDASVFQYSSLSPTAGARPPVVVVAPSASKTVDCPLVSGPAAVRVGGGFEIRPPASPGTQTQHTGPGVLYELVR